MTEEQEKEFLETSKHLPPESVVQFTATIKKFFEEDKVPYNEETLRSALTMCMIIHAGLPPIYGQFTSTSILLLVRLIDEEKSGLITSPIQPIKQ